ncbi:hypothetical protein O6P43_023666 [Quillaja saponaria]|uniref:Uncharacterized protein n=1 Tax=Quillaja saponaria TaxID=32244 RepID=A0AAD7LFS4_QUISA|nr:hypothetical protein O6P43_023666 [Quillaja saponaria]
MPSHLQLQRSKEKPTGAKNKKEEKRINSDTKEEDATAQLPSNIQEVSRAKTGEERTRRTVKVRETQLALKVNCLQLAKEPKLNEEGTTIKEKKKKQHEISKAALQLQLRSSTQENKGNIPHIEGGGRRNRTATRSQSDSQ